MNDFALEQPRITGVFLFEDHKIARASFLLPGNCRKISTRAFLLFLQQQGWVDSAPKENLVKMGVSPLWNGHETLWK